MLRFAELDFQEDRVALEAYEDDGLLVWGVEVETVSQPVSQDGATYPWRPRFSANRLLTTVPGELLELRDLAGRGTSWESVAHEEEPRALLYVFEHTAVESATVSLSLSRDVLMLSWSGIAEFRGGAPFDRHVPFEMRVAVGEVILLGGRAAEAVARARFEPFLSTVAFGYDPVRHQLRRDMPRPQ
jgi:hypothetical protein